MNLKKDYIIELFTNVKALKEEGIYLSGIMYEGEYKSWHKNGQLLQHTFHIKRSDFSGEKIGEAKLFDLDGQLRIHSFYKDGQKVNMPDNVKDGYILVDGKYYKD